MNKSQHSWNWTGGKTISSHGYILLYIGKGQHLADVRGYVYEHRLIIEKKLGRELRSGEKVHHINGNKQDNDPGNLEVVNSNAEHYFLHRKNDCLLRKPGENNPEIQCKCGCGIILLKYDKSGRPRKFVTGHNTIAQYQKEEVKNG